MISWWTSAPFSHELELVCPWHPSYIPPKNVDFSSGNLRLKPGDTSIHQTVGIGMTVPQIIGQLMHSPPLTSPVYDITWSVGGKHGTLGNMKVTGTTKLMQDRVSKQEKKGYIFIELTSAATAFSGTKVTLYHGTSGAAAALIVSGGFRPSVGGNLGAGVYMSRDLKICKMFMKAGGNILKGDVDVGTVFIATGWDQTGASWAGYDTVFLSAACSSRSLEEWTIRDPARIKGIAIHM